MGIKIIKLNAWEKVFTEKIQRSREKELHCLDKDSIYWTLMSECIALHTFTKIQSEHILFIFQHFLHICRRLL